MRFEIIEGGFFKLDGGAMFGVVPKSLWEKLNPPDTQNLCTWSMRLVYIELGNQKILMDTGMGTKQSDKFFGHYLPHGSTLKQSLQDKNIELHQITDVLLTHLHFDHCGGAITQKEGSLLPYFPEARYWCSKSQWEWALHPNDREKASFLNENILPLLESGKLHFITQAGNWIPGIDIRLYNGHTEGMVIPLIKWGHKTLVYMADLLPSVAHIPLPYIMAYDTRPLISLVEKRSFLEEAAQKEFILILEHDPVHECCTVQKTDKGVRLKKTMTLQEALL